VAPEKKKNLKLIGVRKQKGKAEQTTLSYTSVRTTSSDGQQYDHTATINSIRQQVGQWRRIPNPSDWHVTPETARLLHHWRHHPFSSIRPFFCQIEAVETVIWLTEVAGESAAGGRRSLIVATPTRRARFLTQVRAP
jgi:type III restriction enzyme